MWAKAFDYIRWPAVLGLLAALIVLQLFPELNPRNKSITPTNPSFSVAGNHYEPGVTSY